MGELALVVHTESTADGSTHIGVLGPLTHATAPALRDALRRVIDADPAPRLRLDLPASPTSTASSRFPSPNTPPSSAAETYTSTTFPP